MYSQKSLKTILRYPGGKSRAVPKIDTYIPDLRNYQEYREPFLGGGSVAIHITKKYSNLKIWVNDLYEPLVNFWKQVQNSGEELKKSLIEYKLSHNSPDSARELFLYAKNNINDEKVSSFDRAVSFYIVNKCSFSGLTESSSFSQQASTNNFTVRGIEKIPEYSKIIKNWHITNFDYTFLMSESGTADVFMYLDPPYDIKDNLYGRKG